VLALVTNHLRTAYGAYSGKVERLLAWLSNFRRLVVRYERRAENYPGFSHLGCIIILLKHL